MRGLRDLRPASAILTASLLISCAVSPHAAATPPVSPLSPAADSPSPAPSLRVAQRVEQSLPVALEEAAAAAAGGRLFVIGGFDATGNSLRTVWVFDGSTWSAGPPLPLGLDHTSAATLDDHVYVAGGHSYGRDSARTFRFDGGSWTELAQMRHPRGGHALLAAGGRLYAIGGNSGFTNVAPAEVYDPASGAWADLPSLPVPRNHVSGFVADADVCVAGGRAPTTARVDCFNTAGSTWVRWPDLPSPTSGAGATTLSDGRAVIIGGQDAQETRINDQFAHLTYFHLWDAADTMLVPRHGFELALFEGRAWACGGGSLPGLHPVATCTSVL